MAQRRVISTAHAPRPVGPYGQAVIAGDLVYTVGVVGNDPTTSRLVAGGLDDEVNQALRNLRAILEAAGSGLESIVKATVFLEDIADEPVVAKAWRSAVGQPPPAWSTVEVAGMPLGAAVEVECVALVQSIEGASG